MPPVMVAGHRFIGRWPLFAEVVVNRCPGDTEHARDVSRHSLGAKAACRLKGQDEFLAFIARKPAQRPVVFEQILPDEGVDLRLPVVVEE